MTHAGTEPNIFLTSVKLPSSLNQPIIDFCDTLVACSGSILKVSLHSQNTKNKKIMLNTSRKALNYQAQKAILVLINNGLVFTDSRIVPTTGAKQYRSR